MNQLSHKLKLVELESQMELLKQRAPLEDILMTESSQDTSGFEAKFGLSSKIKATLKEINVLIAQKASYTMMMSLHQKLSYNSIYISNQILTRIDSVNILREIIVRFKIYYKIILWQSIL